MTDDDRLEHGTPVERRLGEVLADVGTRDGPSGERFAPTVMRRAKHQLMLRHTLRVLISIAEAVPRTIAVLAGTSGARDRRRDRQ
jgi:hypothetical protein